MKALHSLPENYSEFFSIDLQKNKKMALVINLLSVVIAVILIVPAAFFVPITTMFQAETENNVFENAEFWTKIIPLLLLLVAYVILHELVHGVAMKICGTKKVKYGFTGMYAFAGSDDYYDKKSYIFIALAPVVLWGAVLAIINCFVPVGWFWVVYFIQVINLSGAAGDFYVTVKFSKFPKDIIIKDHGVGMTVYSREQKVK